MTLTSGERMWLWRRVNRVTLRQAARRFGVDRQRLWMPAEHGKIASPAWLLRKIPAIKLTPALRLRLARRRARMTLTEAARAFGRSRVWFIALESRGDARIEAFWRSRGCLP